MGEDKWREQDLPTVVKALEKARKSKLFSTITVVISPDGGMLGCKLVCEEKLK